MKKMLFLLMLSLMIGGCIDNDGVVERIRDSEGYSRRVITIDGCEYFAGAYYMLEHKGNCKNPIHIYNKEKK